MKRFALFLVLSFLGACASTASKSIPTLQEAQAMRGQSTELVKKQLGNPADEQKNGRLFWFLNTESKYHPEPKAQLFEFLFKQDRLLEIKAVKK